MKRGTRATVVLAAESLATSWMGPASTKPMKVVRAKAKTKSEGTIARMAISLLRVGLAV